MAYTITAQLRLQTPPLQQINRIKRDIEAALSGIKLSINNKSISALNAYLKQASTQAGKLSDSLQNVGTSTRYINASAAAFNKMATSTNNAVQQTKALATNTRATTTAITTQGNAFDISRKKMAAYLGGGLLVREFAYAFRDSFRQSVSFQTELSKIGMITSATIVQQEQLGAEIRKVAADWGASGQQIATATKLLASAGIQFETLKDTAKLLAAINIGASFEGDSLDAAANSIVLLNSVFKQSTAREYASSLEKINNLSNLYPAEAKSIVAGLSITGSAAVSANMSFSDLIATLVTLKSKTRESDEVVATTLRNVFTRMQRFESIDILKSMGINPVNVDNTFRPMFDVMTELANVVNTTPIGDVALMNKVENLVGQRQASRMITLMRGWSMAEEAKNAALKNGQSLEDARTRRLATVAGQLQAAKENMLAFTDALVQSSGAFTLVKSVNNLSNSLAKLLSVLIDLTPVLAAVAAYKLGGLFAQTKWNQGVHRNVGLATAYRATTTNEHVAAAQTAMQTGKPEDIAAARAAGLVRIAAERQYQSVMKLNNAYVRMTSATGVAEKAFYGIKYGVTAASQALKLYGRQMTMGYMALTAFALSMVEQTPKTEAAFNTVTVGLIAMAAGLNPAIVGLSMFAVGIISFVRALDQEKRNLEKKTLSNIDADVAARKAAVVTGAPGAEQQLEALDIEGLLKKANAIQQRTGESTLDMGWLEQQGRTLSNLFTGKWGTLTRNAINEELTTKHQGAIKEDVAALRPEVIGKLSQRAQQLGNMNAVRNDPLSQQLYKTLKMFDLLNGTVGETDKIFNQLFASLEEQAARTIGGTNTQIGLAGNLAGRANAIRQNTNSVELAQQMASIPLTNLERVATAEIDKAFSILPQILSNVQFNSKDWQSQLTSSMAASGLDQAIVSSVDAAIDEMTFEEFEQSLQDTSSASSNLLKQYQSHREAISSLIDATKLAADSLRTKLTTAIENISSYQNERQKLATMAMDYNSFVRRPTNAADVEAVRQQDIRELSGGDFSVEQMGEAARNYAAALDSGTATLMDIPLLETGLTRLKTALGKAADASATLAAIEKRRSEVEESKSGKLNAVEAIVRDPQAVAKQMRAMDDMWNKGIMNLPQEQRDQALAGMDTFANVKLQKFGGLTGAQMKERVLSTEGAKMGLSVAPENAELLRLNEASKLVQEQALQAQLQLVQLAAQTAQNTAKLAGVPFAPPIVAAPAPGAAPQPGPMAGVFNIKDSVSLRDKPQTAASNAGVATVDPNLGIQAANAIQQAATKLADTAAMFNGLTVTHVGNFSVEVIHNGAQIFNTLTDSVQTLVAQTVKTAIDSMLSQKFGLPPMDVAIS